MPLHYLYSMPVICDLQQLQPSIFDQNLYSSSSCINRVFHHLLQSIHRRDNDLASGDFVDDILVEWLPTISPTLTYLKSS